MSTPIPNLDDRPPQNPQKVTPLFLSNKSIINLFKTLIFSVLFMFPFYTLLSNHGFYQSPQYISKLKQTQTLYSHNNQTQNSSTHSPTNLSHIIIGITSSANTWKDRIPFIESWWRPNVTKGFVYLDREPTEFLPWPSTSPLYRVSENTSRYDPYDRHPFRFAIRKVRVIVELFREVHDEGIRWFVLADDDTILFIDNLLDVLNKYDHRKYFYIGKNSECVLSNFDHSYEMAFGGAGSAISYPLASALSKNMDTCIKRYPDVYGSDQLLQSCIADLGISLTHERGFHQVDLHSDVRGLLSSHPHSPLVSLHHLDLIEPLFPDMNRTESLNHLMKAAKEDQPRLLQQTICYDNSKNWSFSVAWGYTAELYEQIIHPSVLQKPLETFDPWMTPAPLQRFMFNTRLPSTNPCDMPHVFFLQSVERLEGKKKFVTTYTRRSPRNMPPCSQSPTPNHSFPLASDIAKIVVISPISKYLAEEGNRRECCKVIKKVEKNITKIKYRSCSKDEIVGVH